MVIYDLYNIVNTVGELAGKLEIPRSRCKAAEAAGVWITFAKQGVNGFSQYFKLDCNLLPTP